jgi:hypothetical protein
MNNYELKQPTSKFKINNSKTSTKTTANLMFSKTDQAIILNITNKILQIKYVK